MHKHSEKQNNWKWNSDKPKQDAFSERHDSLHSILTATLAGSIGSIAGLPCHATSQAAVKEAPGRCDVPAFRSGGTSESVLGLDIDD
jgi:hypothetical protein